MHFKSFVRFWWRRRIFYLRQRSPLWYFIVTLCLLSIFFWIPNPFSSRYVRRPLNQNVHWVNVKETLALKEKIWETERLPDRIKVIHDGNSSELFSSSSPILIVLYTTVFHEKKFCSMTMERLFGSSCPVRNRCQWSCDKRRIHEADAIIFHAFDILYYRLILPERSQTKSNSIWILWSDEPPSIIDYDRLKSYRFNWTIGYRLHSEVSIGAYGLFSERDDRLSDDEFERWIDEQFQRRDQGALWFVSNCHAKKRLEIYRDLKRFSPMNIEGYGRCVDFYPWHLCQSYSQCEEDYMSKFKFYFSFESNTCRDYITEKFYKAFYFNLIPIVHGPERKNYESLAPKDSFIHAEQFANDRQEFANYLNEINRNRTLFASFHQWRKSSRVIVDGQALERIRMCELCTRLTRVRQGQSTSYEHLSEFYREQCRSN